MTFETTAAGNKNGSTRPKGTNCLSLHDRTSLPVFFVGQYTGKRGRLQYGIFNKNRRAAGGGLHVSAMTNKNANAGLGVLRIFRMHRKGAGFAPAAHPFLPRQKRYGPRSGGCGFANCTASPAHSNCTSGGIPRHPAQKNSPFLGLLLRAKLSTCGCGLFTNFLFTTAQQMFHKIACGQI